MYGLYLDDVREQVRRLPTRSVSSIYIYIYITVVLGLKSWVGIKLLVWILRIIDNCVVVINFRMVRTRQGTRTELPFLERRGGSQVA